MTSPHTSTLYVTFIEKENACLKVWGQTDKNLPIAVEKSLAQATPVFEQGHHIPPPEALYPGLLLCAKFKDGMYYRARVTNVSLLHQGLVEVHFIDYGNREFLPFLHTRLMGDSALKDIMAIPPQVKEFILAHVTHPGSAWDDNTISLINSEIRYAEMHCILIGQVGPYSLIRLLNSSGDDVALNFISRRLLLSVSLHTQQMILHSYTGRNSVSLSPLPNTPVQSTPPMVLQSTPSQSIPTTPTLLSYKALSLEPGSQHAIYVSYVSDGPLQFSVQLRKMEDTLAKLMNELHVIALEPLDEIPIPGTVCVARCEEDNYLCRAVVTSMVDSLYKVFYVDFGNTEVVPLTHLYQIPFKYVIPKVMAMRFALAGLKKSNVTLEMKCAFKDFVCNRPLTMRVSSDSHRSALPTCEIWDENNVNALDVLKKAAMISYPDPFVLNRGLNQDIRVSYVYSCSRFFIQLKNKEKDLNALMAELQVTYAEREALDPEAMKEGIPCCALYEADGQWYRAQTISVTRDGIKVRYIDYGNEEMVQRHNLKKLEAEHVTSLKPQALECCLNGYQNMEQDQERDNLLEELILEKDFSMKVVDTQENRVLVELFDSERYNVSSLLLEKIALKRSQVSPMLIQEGLQFDHRKRSSIDENQKGVGSKKSDSGDSWGEKKDNWRQNRSPRKDYNAENNAGFHARDESRRGFRDNKSNERKPNNFREQRDNKFDGGSDHKFDGRDHSKFDRRDNNKFDGPKRDFRERRERNDFGSRNSDRNTLHNRERIATSNSSSSGGGYQKRFDNKRDGSEKSWSDGSEKGYKRGPRTSTRNDKPKFNKKFDQPSGSSYPSSGDKETWDISAVQDLRDYAPNDAIYDVLQLIGTTSQVMISWFHNPSLFYCQLDNMKDKIRLMMDDIQTSYVTRKSASATSGAPVIAIFPEDSVLYRAQVLENHPNKYRVFYVDFGNTATVNEVYPIERKFMELPAQAIRCCLRGVAPLEHNWAMPDAYAEYFGKDAFMCSFVSYENEQYVVDLTSGEQNVAELLVAGGLAKPLSHGASQIEIDILKGQQLRVSVVSVESLGNFQVFIAPDLTLRCAAHNLDNATQTYLDKLKEQTGNNVIIYVDEVIDERLIVTVYDTQGYKIAVVEPDEGAFDELDPLCPLPVFYSIFYGWVTHVTPQSIYVQPTGFADTIAQLLEQLFQHYQKTILEIPIIPEVDVVYAVLSPDGNWYRARTVSVEEEMATFLYVDYGNIEQIAITNVRELDVSFLELHMLALEVNLGEAKEGLLEKEVTLQLEYNEGWCGKIIEAEVPAETGGIVTTDTTEQLEEVPGIAQEPQSLEQSGVSVILTHFDSPSEFYLQLSQASESVGKLQADLQQAVPELPNLDNPSAGVLCAAPYSLDQQWYRAQVLDADADITTVRFVDYGNTDVLENSVTAVKTLPPELLTLEQHARRCSLNVIPFEEEWSPAALKRFEELTAESELTAEIVSQDEKTTYIELLSEGRNIGQLLVEEQLARISECPPEPLATGYVSNLNSPSEFWVQLESSVADLEWIADQLSAAETFPELEDFTPGSLCAAIFPEDDNWYRARILSNTVAGLEVLFIDYGNSCTCTCLRALPEDLLLMPALAQKCSLQKPEGIDQWTPQACDKFKEIAADGATIFSVKKLTTGETAIVELLLDGESVSLMLLPKTVDCHVIKFESLDSFHIKKHDDAEEFNTICKLEPLPGFQWAEESKKMFEDLNNNCQAVFQVEFVTSDLVRLYIDGRDIRSKLGGIRITPTNSTTTTPKKYVDAEVSSERNIEEDVSTLAVEIVNSSAVSKENKNTESVEQILDKDGRERVRQLASDLPEAKEAPGDAKNTDEISDTNKPQSCAEGAQNVLPSAPTRDKSHVKDTELANNLPDPKKKESDLQHTESVPQLKRDVSDSSQNVTESVAKTAKDKLLTETINSFTEEQMADKKNTQDTLNAVAETLDDMIDSITMNGKSKVDAPEKHVSGSSSRASSQCSGRFDVEERVVPAAVSRPRTPEPVSADSAA